MLQRKQVYLFLLKAIAVYALLALPLRTYDEQYGKFYRSVSTSLFAKFGDSGLTRFRGTADKKVTNVYVGNYAQVQEDKTTRTAISDINTRYRGYMPTILFIALVIATPLPFRRKMFVLLFGLFLVTAFVMVKQWIHLQYICEQNPWLNLVEFSDSGKRNVEFFYNTFVAYISPTLFLVVAIWMAVSFRLADLQK